MTLAIALKHLELSRVWVNDACNHWFQAVPVRAGDGDGDVDGDGRVVSSAVPKEFRNHAASDHVKQALLNKTLSANEVDSVIASFVDVLYVSHNGTVC